FALVCVALAAVTAPPGAAAGDGAAGAGVHGRVLTQEGNGRLRAVAGARVEFKRADGKPAARVTADAHGYYKADLIAGSYRFTVEAPGLRLENVGRGLTLTLSQGYAVFNFTLVKDDGSAPPAKDPKPPKDDGSAPPAKAEEPAAVTVGVLRGQVYEKTPAGELKGVNGATVTLRPSQGGS